MTSEYLIVEQSDGIGRLVFNRADKHNAISFEMWQGIAAAMAQFEADDAVRVVVVSGAGGKAFSAGADISQFEGQRDGKDATAAYNAAVRAAYDALSAIEKPTIAQIAGYCIGGGCATAMCCDIRLASEDSSFGIPAAKLGLGYDYDSLRPLVALVGPTAAKEILFTARQFDAEEALRLGIVNRIVACDELDACVEDYAGRIASNAPLTVRACKRIIGEVLKDPAERDIEACRKLVADCYESEDYKEGRRAFMEKRRPSFRGR